MIKRRCEYCDKVFEAYSEDELSNQIIIHKIHKHPDKIEIKEIKKGDKK